MLTQFRKFQKGTLIVVTVFIVIAFAFLYSDFDFAKGTFGKASCIVEVDNKCYSITEIKKLANYHDLAFNLDLDDFARTLRGPTRRDADPTEFVKNLIVLRKEAKKLGIEPTREEINATIPKLPVFRRIPFGKGKILENLLGQLGLTDADLGQLTKDYLCFQKIRDLVGAGIQAVPIQTEKTYIQENQLYTASVVNFNRSDYLDQIEITEEEIKKYFDDRQSKPTTPPDQATPKEEKGQTPDQAKPSSEKPLDQLLTAPKRGFEHVKFTPKKLPENATAEEKSVAEHDFASAVNDIYSRLTAEDADFMAVAKEQAARDTPFSIEATKLEPFKQSEPPESLQKNPQLLDAIFSGTLRKGQVGLPQLDPKDGSYHVFKFTDDDAPRPMTLEEAREPIIKALKLKKSDQLAGDAAKAGLAKMQEAINAGKSILDAASANNFDLVSLPVFSEGSHPEGVDDPPLVVASVREVQPGQLSQFMKKSGGKGYFFTHVEKTEIYRDEAKDGTLRMIGAVAEYSEKQDLFLAWLNQKAEERGAKRTANIREVPAPL